MSYKLYETTPPGFPSYVIMSLVDDDGYFLMLNGNGEYSEGTWNPPDTANWVEIACVSPLQWLRCAECNSVSFADYLCDTCRENL